METEEPCSQKSHPLVPILSQLNPVRTSSPFFPEIFSNVTTSLLRNASQSLRNVRI